MGVFLSTDFFDLVNKNCNFVVSLTLHGCHRQSTLSSLQLWITASFADLTAQVKLSMCKSGNRCRDSERRTDRKSEKLLLAAQTQISL